jgi:hypothetical protein
MEKALYYQTYPLGIISISKLAAIIAFAVGIFGTIVLNVYYTLVFLLLYAVALIYNIKFRAIMCGYYGATIHSKFGKFVQKFPPNVDPEKIQNSSGVLIFLAINSYIIMIFPAVGGIIRLVQAIIASETITAIIAAIILLAYFSSLVVPSIALKKKIFPAFCEA